MRWLLPSIALLLAALLAVWMLDSDQPTALPDLPRAGGPRDGSSPGTGEAARGELAEASADDRSAALPAGLRREDGTAAAADGEPGPRLRVVRGTDGPPVADADVFFLEEQRYRDTRRDGDVTSRWEAPERFGQRRRTDPDGYAPLPGGGGRYLCSAIADGDYGFVVVRARPGEHTLVLEPDEQFEIEVAHADGTPAAIPLVVLQMDEPDDSDTIWRGDSGLDGKAVVRHFQKLRERRDRRLPETVAERFAVAARIPTQPASLTEFDGRPAPEQTVRLQLPPFGGFEVQLVDHGGTPLLSPAQVLFGIDGDARTEGAYPMSRWVTWQREDKPAGAVPVAFPFAPVGQPLRVFARYPDERRPARVNGAAGPTEAGETAVLQVPPDDRHCVFAGRLLGPDRRPIAAERVAVTIWRDDAVLSTANAQTVADGRWDLVQSGRTDEARWRMEFRYRGEGSGDDAPTRWLGAFVDLPPWPPKKRIELGEVVLDVLPPLCAGIVVDDVGQPIVGATVELQQQRVSRRRGSRPRTPPRGGRIVIDRSSSTATSVSWRDLPNLRTRTDDDGRFALSGQMPPGELRVHADSPSHFADSVPFEQPSQNLRVELERNGTLDGRLLMPDWLPDQAVELTMVPFEQERQKRDTRSERVRTRRGGRFRIEPLRAGRYDLRVTIRNLDGPLLTLRDVFVRPEPTTDPRLQPLDLRQSLFRYRLRALDRSGQPMPIDGPIRARLTADDGSTVDAGFRWQDGRAELITSHQLAELTFFGRGYVPKTEQFVPGEHDVYLQKMQPALVDVPGARSLCGPTRKVRISAILQGDTGYPSSLGGVDQRTGRRFSFPRWDLGRSSGGWLGDTDLVQIPLMKAGKYQIILRAHATESVRTPQVSVTLGEVELKPDGVTVVTVPVDSAAVMKALEQVDKQQQERQRSRQR